MKEKPKVIAIAGATASGKTTYSIELAKKIGGEIVSADSRLVYKGFEIAVAKPSVEEREGIPHYLMDVVEPTEDYTVAKFYDDAKFAIEEIIKKGKTPIVVGGTGLYFRILLENYDLPRIAPNYELRDSLEKLNTEELHKMLFNLNHDAAEKIHFNNKVKIIRAIEIAKSGMEPTIKEPEYDVEWIGMNVERQELYNRINARVDLMYEKGLVDETKKLLEKYGRIKNFIKTIGYQEILAYLDNKISLDDALELIKQNTRRYAKRQLTWFRRNKLLKID